MKKTVSIVFIFLVFTSLFVVFVANNKNSEKNTMLGQINSNTSTNKLFNITSPLGLYSSKYAITDDGFYEILEHSTREGNILYTDVNLNKRMYLSADLGVNPDSPDTTSYIDNISEGACIGITDENIYIFKRGSAQQNTTDENKRTIIEQRNLTGGEIKKVYLDPNIIMTEGGVVVSDGENIYFTVMEYSFDKEGKAIDGIAKIISLNSKTLEVKIIHQFDKRCYVEIRGTSEDNIVINRKYYNEQNKIVSDIIKFNHYTKNITLVKELSGFCTVKIYNNILYIFNNTDYTLEIIDLLNGKSKVYNDLFDKKYEKISLVADIYDNHLFFSMSSNDENEKWSLNLNSLELKKIDMYNDDNFIGIYGEIGEWFLVITGQKTVTYMDTAPDKTTKFEAERFIDDIKLIKKADYWNNNPNFIEIQSDEIIYR